MHGLQHSRGRIFFDAVCAFAVSASCAGAWLQTGASALLPAAGVALLYGLVRLFDMRTGRQEPQRIDFPAEDAPVMMEPVADLPAPVEATAQRASDDLPAKPARKSSARRASAPKKPKLVEVQIADPVEPEASPYHDAADHPPLTPLFEPVPVVREMRTFGRKAG
jgi:hypothetical protein